MHSGYDVITSKAIFLRSDGSIRGTVGSGSTQELKAALLDLRFAVTLDVAIDDAEASVTQSNLIW